MFVKRPTDVPLHAPEDGVTAGRTRRRRAEITVATSTWIPIPNAATRRVPAYAKDEDANLPRLQQFRSDFIENFERIGMNTTPGDAGFSAS